MNDSPPPWLRPFRLPGIEAPDGLDYSHLEEFGVSYESTMSEINRAGLTAQRQKKLTLERKQAWRLLRDAEKRFILDFLHVQTDPAVFGGEPGMPPGVPPLVPPILELPEVPDPSPEEVIAALGPVEPPPLEPLDPGPPPSLVDDVWELLDAFIADVETAPPPLTPPKPFVENE